MKPSDLRQQPAFRAKADAASAAEGGNVDARAQAEAYKGAISDRTTCWSEQQLTQRKISHWVGDTEREAQALSLRI